MKCAVCLKQVPNAVDLRIDPKTNTLIREGVESILNPLDEFPLEAALRLRETEGGTVTALTMGPPQSEEVLRKAIAMGADDGVLLSDRLFAGADTWATSLALARAIGSLGGFELVLCGKQAIDGDTAQVGPGIAAHLGIPQVTYATALRAAACDKLRIRRQFEDGTAEVEVRLPAVVTVLKQANEPRLPNLADRVRSLRAVPRVITATDLGFREEEIGLPGSPTRVVRISVPSTDRANRMLTGTPESCSQKALAELRARGLVPN